MTMGLPSPTSLPSTGPFLDVRRHSCKTSSKGSASDEEVTDIYAYGAGLYSTTAIVGLSQFTHLQTLSLHGNEITRIEGLEVLSHLVTLNLSSNKISWMEGLSQLTKLRVLNLSNNRIQEIAGLQGLVALKTLILSHNEINILSGLSALHGPTYALEHLDLRDNVVEYVCELWILGGCSHLEEVVFQCGGYSNPVCKTSAYCTTLLSLVPRLQTLDGSFCKPSLENMLSSAIPSLWALHHSYPPILNLVVQQQKGPNHNLVDLDMNGASNFKSCQPTYQVQNHATYESNNLGKSHPTHKHDKFLYHNCVKPIDNTESQQGRKNSKTGYDLRGTYFLTHSKRETPIVSDATIDVKHSIHVPIWNESREQELEFHTHNEDGVHPPSEAINSEGREFCTDNNRYVRFVGKSNKSALALSQLRLPRGIDRNTQTTKELAIQTESTAHEVIRLQPNLNTITVVIDGNSSYPGTEKQNVLVNLELQKKENELLSLTKEKQQLEDKFVAFKKCVGHGEKKHDHGHVDNNYKAMILRSLEMNLKGCKSELRSLRAIVLQTESELTTEAKLMESNIMKHVAFNDTTKLSTLSHEIVALKEALNSTMNTCQTVGTALNEANHQKEKAKRTMVSLTKALEEQHSKVKIVTEILENCTYKEKRSKKECIRLQSELNLVCQVLRKNKETEDLAEVKSTHWQAQGREEAEKVWRQWSKEVQGRLVVTQTMFAQVLQENANILLDVNSLRDMMNEKIGELRNVWDAVMEKERGAKELITELSFVVSAQKKRSEWMQLEMDRLTATKKGKVTIERNSMTNVEIDEKVVHDEVERLRAEQIEKNNAIEKKAMEMEAVRWELANVKSCAERDRQALDSLLLENETLATRDSSLTHKIQETQDIIMARNEVCESQEAIIEQLKDELEEARNAGCVSEENIKALEVELVQRLQCEVNEKLELRYQLARHEAIISKMDEELEVSKVAKYGAEQACRSLQEKVNNVDLMLRDVDEEIEGVKTLYEGREMTISIERDNALAKVTALQKKLDNAEVSATIAMQAHFEATKLMEAKEQKTNTTLIQKDILVEDLKRKVLEVEAQLLSRNLALETQKAISIAKVEQLGKVLDELREVT